MNEEEVQTDADRQRLEQAAESWGAGQQEQRGDARRWDSEELPPALPRHPATMSHITLTSLRS